MGRYSDTSTDAIYWEEKGATEEGREGVCLNILASSWATASFTVTCITYA